MKTLVIYASKHGAAKRCASTLSEKLIGKIDLYNLNDGNIPDISQYDRVVIGGSIYAGRIQKEINEFCLKNLNLLQEKKIGLYICCMNKSAAETQLNSAYPKKLLGCAVAKESFGGEFKFNEMNFFEKTITKMVTKTLKKEDPSVPDIDMKKDLSLISQENINKFAQLMNSAS
jgi:menaquinone-dependent protoporphyrinogen oxidase